MECFIGTVGFKDCFVKNKHNFQNITYLSFMKKIKIILFSLLALIALAFIGLYTFYKIKNVETKTMDAEARKNSSGQFIQLSDGITHYEVAGVDTAKTILLVHGFSVPAYIWGATFDSLVQQGFRVVRYDGFGRGYSDRPDVDYTPAFYRKQLLDLINSLKLKTPIDIAGLSFGGAVVTDFAVHYPSLIDKIILVDPVYRFKKMDGAEMIANYSMAIHPDKQAGGQLEDFKYPEQFPDWVNQYKVQMQYKGFRHALISTLLNYPGDTMVANYRKLEALHKKVLLIWGKEDQTVTFNFSDSLRQQLKVDFFPINDARHLPHLEKPMLVNQKIISFLK
jgi:pimeloyl-ACP methyl ester carboxylesterase